MKYIDDINTLATEGHAACVLSCMPDCIKGNTHRDIYRR
jgi:hypothetical protein